MRTNMKTQKESTISTSSNRWAISSFISVPLISVSFQPPMRTSLLLYDQKPSTKQKVLCGIPGKEKQVENAEKWITSRKHCMNTKNKVAARNNVVRKLTGTTWGAQPDTVRTSALTIKDKECGQEQPIEKQQVASGHTRQQAVDNIKCLMLTVQC
ncbi:uncharacterized protein mRpS10 isoform X2 [Anabrus simplex]|uniref:uncharacterized protein mRpS10 isoform X2 n=1 Tax=Anabrus simplex TaxID=316456 RepID=UPI0034DDAA65